MSDFEKFMQNQGGSDEILCVTDMAKGNEEYEKAIIDFIKRNNIDCTHLWEDGKEGDKSTEDWEKLIAFVLDLIPENNKDIVGK